LVLFSKTKKNKMGISNTTKKGFETLPEDLIGN
jgi:hypothetical protein